jgi:hypothetical protein
MNKYNSYPLRHFDVFEKHSPQSCSSVYPNKCVGTILDLEQ